MLISYFLNLSPLQEAKVFDAAEFEPEKDDDYRII